MWLTERTRQFYTSHPAEKKKCQNPAPCESTFNDLNDLLLLLLLVEPLMISLSVSPPPVSGSLEVTVIVD